MDGLDGRIDFDFDLLIIDLIDGIDELTRRSTRQEFSVLRFSVGCLLSAAAASETETEIEKLKLKLKLDSGFR